ncbi:hypothetical protein RHMOL_Rhmol11G0207500 [Rhododendron molle]|uniref:Uncharacterized protein n=1 Tax=Rhododendron molle TaxID=49168 RepID=A0ACC0LUG1_RHOML|nr:hypothetical protein RHMOL_Rhmol11G0207500 [Rhododendron molle]
MCRTTEHGANRDGTGDEARTTEHRANRDGTGDEASNDEEKSHMGIAGNFLYLSVTKSVPMNQTNLSSPFHSHCREVAWPKDKSLPRKIDPVSGKSRRGTLINHCDNLFRLK